MKTRLIPLLILIPITMCLLAGGCIKPKPKPTAAPQTPPLSLEAKAPVEPKEFSPVAFLDESLYASGRELFFSPDGRMIKQAAYFGGTEKVLALVTDYDLARTQDCAGPLYLVNTDDASDVMQLKGASAVLSFTNEPTGGVYYHEVKEGERDVPPEEGSEGQVVQHSPIVNTKAIPHHLTVEGQDTALEMENKFVDYVLPDGKLLLAHVVDLTPFAGGFIRGLATKWAVYDPAAKKELHSFDFAPLLDPALTTSLEVVRYYDSANYGDSYFALYQGTPGTPSAQLKLVFSCPYFITLTSERWMPPAEFIDAKHVLVGRFDPADAVAGEQGAVPNSRGTLTLESFDVTTHRLRTLVKDVPPYIRVFTQMDAPVFFYVSYQIPELVRRHSIWSAAADGTKARKLAENTTARRVRIMDVDYKSGRLLVVEDYETSSGSYSLLREYKLSTAAPPPEPPSGKEEPLSGAPAPQQGAQPPASEGAEGPPPISLPGANT